MRASSKQARGTVKEPFGGVTAVGMKATSEMEFKVDGVFSIGREESNSTKVTGITACSMARELSTSKTVSVTRVPSKRINSTAKVFSTRMIR